MDRIIMNRETGRPARPWCRIHLLLIAAAMLAAASPGCLLLLQQGGESNTSGALPATVPEHAALAAAPPSVVPAPAPVSLPCIAEAAPILTPDPYPLPPHILPNVTWKREQPVPWFARTYALRGNATGLIVNVTRGPLIISWNVMPSCDTIADPGSCRGSRENGRNLPYFTLTVRNATTREIVLADGYGREYSSQKENRTVRIFSEGSFHITLAGNYLDVALSIATGEAPGTVPAAAPAAAAGPGPKVPPPEIPEAIRQARGEI